MTVMKAGAITGHVPRKITAACSLLLWNHECIIMGSLCYARDLVNRGIKVPCRFTFTGERNYVEKVKKLIKLVDTIMSSSRGSMSPAVTPISTSDIIGGSHA